MLGIMANSRRRAQPPPPPVSIDQIYARGSGYSTIQLTWNVALGYTPTAGDIILIFHQCSTPSIPNTPAGWTLINKTQSTQIIAKVSDGTELGITLSGSVKGNSGCVYFLKGGQAVSGITAATLAGATAPSMTPVADGALLLTAHVNDNALYTTSAPPGMTFGAAFGRGLTPVHGASSSYLLDNTGGVGTGTKSIAATLTRAFSVIVEIA